MNTLLQFNVIQIRDRIDGRIGFVDKSMWMKKGATSFNDFKMGDVPYAVTVDEYVEVMIFIHEKNYSLVRCVSYDTLCELSQRWKSDFFKT